MSQLNRVALIVKPCLACIQWIRGLAGEAEDLNLSAEYLRSQGGVYLVDFDPELSDEEMLELHYDVIFESELEQWMPDQTKWPSRRDIETFRRWFDVEIRLGVVDLGFDEPYSDIDMLDVIAPAASDVDAQARWLDKGLPAP